MTTLILVTAVAFASTNLDDIVVLLSLFADASLRPREVVAGQYLGMAILTSVALAGSLVVRVVPEAYVGLLGILPFAIGLRRLLTEQDGPEPTGPHGAVGSLTRIVAAAAVTTASGGDNVAVYVPLLVGRSSSEVTVVIAVFGIMTAAWCLIARFVVQYFRTGLPIRRFGRLIVPWVYIGLGVYVVVASRAYSLSGIRGR
jgi:cadmium resistance protein CadD (predicted permease)